MQRSLFLSAAAAFLLLAACAKSPDQQLSSARSQAKAGKHDKAVSIYDKLLEAPGSHAAVAQLERAQSLYALKQYAEAARGALAAAQGQGPVAAKPARVLALQALSMADDKVEGAKVLALLGPDAMSDPAVAEAAKRLGLGAPAPAAAAASGAAPKSGRKLDLAHTNALHVDISAVMEAASADPSTYSVRVAFQDPKQVVKVPSPDGKQLVWRALDQGKGYYLWLSGADGKDPKRLDACKNGFQPVWSPDGKRILFSAMDWRTEERNLFIYDLAKGKSRRAFNASKKVGPLAAWSPDGSKIVFTYFDELWIMNANGIGRGLLNLGGRMKMNVEDAGLFAWSQDGSRLAYAPQSDPSKVYLIDLTSKI
jgi:hypothetical protein